MKSLCHLWLLSQYSHFISPKATLVVNVASYCQHTDKNYIALQDLHREFGPSHFTVLAFPCNQFGESEPGSSQEIEAFAKGNYGVTFPVFHKIKILGSEAEPAFKFLIGNYFISYTELPISMVFFNSSWSLTGLVWEYIICLHSLWRKKKAFFAHNLSHFKLDIKNKNKKTKKNKESKELYPESIHFSSLTIRTSCCDQPG